MIQRIRQKEIMAPANPRTLDELVIPAEYKTTIDGKPFLLYDSNDEKSGKPRTLIYSTEENLNLMTNCNNWYADGTFSSLVHHLFFTNYIPFMVYNTVTFCHFYSLYFQIKRKKLMSVYLK